MKIKVSILQNALIISATLAVLIVFGMVMLNSASRATAGGSSAFSNATMEGDNQVINITAAAGYLPNSIMAKANVNTILKVTTNNNFDCSSSMRIPALKINNSLPATGTTVIPLGMQSPGSEIKGTCAMGMYNFKIKFN